MSPSRPLPVSSRIPALLFAAGILIAFAGLAGLAATALPSSAPAGPVPGGRGHDPSRLHPMRIGAKYGYADAAGKLIIPARYDMADTFSDGMAVVGERGRFGYIDDRGTLAIPAVFRSALPFHDGFAAVRNGNDWLYLDRVGHPVAGRPGAPEALASGDSAR